MTFVRLILHCDDQNLALACDAAKWLLDRPEHKECASTFGQGANSIMMFSKRLKRSIRVQQVRP